MVLHGDFLLQIETKVWCQCLLLVFWLMHISLQVALVNAIFTSKIEKKGCTVGWIQLLCANETVEHKMLLRVKVTLNELSLFTFLPHEISTTHWGGGTSEQRNSADIMATVKTVKVAHTFFFFFSFSEIYLSSSFNCNIVFSIILSILFRIIRSATWCRDKLF